MNTTQSSQEEGTARRESKRAQWTYNPEMEIHISHNLLDAPSPSHHAHLEPKPPRRRSHGACPRAPCSMHSKCFRTCIRSAFELHHRGAAPMSPVQRPRPRAPCLTTAGVARVAARARHGHGTGTAGARLGARVPLRRRARRRRSACRYLLDRSP